MMFVELKGRFSFPRSAWQRKTSTLRVGHVAKAPQSGSELRAHAERGNEVSDFTLPEFPVPLPRPRRGLSLTEVLISMGILTVGLLSVASIFPVGSFYMQKAEISDKASAIAQSVMNEIMARGMLNPRSWYVMVPSPSASGSAAPNSFFSGLDGKYAPFTQPATSSATVSLFLRPFAETLGESLKRNTDPTTAPGILAKQFGHAFVIDPMYVAAVAKIKPDPNIVVAYPFPATAFQIYPWPSSTYYGSAGWNPWRVSSGGKGNEETWPIRRVTFQQASGWPLDQTMAESLFRGNDDLSVELPTRDDRPGIQTWDVSGSMPLARKWAGDYSWIVSVVPTTNAARDGMVRNPEGFAYDVSVVVFHKRTLPTGASDMMDAASHERMVGAKIISTGLNGGELLLTDMYDVFDSNNNRVSPFSQLKSGQWIMLCGPHPNSSAAEPRFVLNWYQVISIGTDGAGISGFDPNSQRVVTVRGAQWPWQPRLAYSSSQQSSDVARLSDDLCVGIFRGAAAVHTKIIRLENSSATGTASLVIPNAVTPPAYDAR